ncbi:MAG: universal stress protein [Cyanobacterium sp. T60_A2020_053]|nr:universal stress protein [Cyanobacterium sp. T60_A2020_053]
MEQVSSTHETSAPRPSFQRILVALEYPLTSSEILAVALDIAEKYQGNLMMCHCLEENLAPHSEMLMPSMISTGIYSAEIWEVEAEVFAEHRDKIRTWLHSLNEETQSKGIQSDYVCLTGNTGAEIVALAKDWGADLIVTGRRGRKGLSEAFLGSVSNYVFHHASCPVLVVQHQDNG